MAVNGTGRKSRRTNVSRGTKNETTTTELDRINSGAGAAADRGHYGSGTRRNRHGRHQAGQHRPDHVLPVVEIGRELPGRTEPREKRAYGRYARAIAGTSGHGGINSAGNAHRGRCSGGRSAQSGAGRPTKRGNAATGAYRQD